MLPCASTVLSDVPTAGLSDAGPTACSRARCDRARAARQRAPILTPARPLLQAMPWPCLRRRSSQHPSSEGASSLSLCSRSLSRKSWPCRKSAGSVEGRDFDNEEEITQPAAPRLTRRSLTEAPVGGGQFGSLLLSTSNFRQHLGCQFEDVIVEALLSQIFAHLSLQVRPLFAGQACARCGRAGGS